VESAPARRIVVTRRNNFQQVNHDVVKSMLIQIKFRRSWAGRCPSPTAITHTQTKWKDHCTPTRVPAPFGQQSIRRRRLRCELAQPRLWRIRLIVSMKPISVNENSLLRRKNSCSRKVSESPHEPAGAAFSLLHAASRQTVEAGDGSHHLTTPEMQHGLCRGGITRFLRKQRASGPR
jgi:hypothetical protein